MKKSSLILPLVLPLILLLTVQASVEVCSGVIRVPNDYPTIQGAIDEADPKGIVLVSEGVYYEHLVVNKPLTLVGSDRATTILDGNETGTVVDIRANNVTIDGFTIRNGQQGILIEQFNGSVVRNNIIALNEFWGVLVRESSTNLIEDNLILRNGKALPGLVYGDGIVLSFSNNDTIVNNTLGWNFVSNIEIDHSHNNIIVNNTVEKSTGGISLRDETCNNTIHHNNFIWNRYNVEGDALSANVWDDGVIGNYWDDYLGLDDGSGSRVAGDGVGDTALPHLEVDYYPLTTPLRSIPIIWETTAYPVTLHSNSTVSAFRFIQSEKKIAFKVTGPSGTVGYCNVTIPKSLLRDNPWRILLNNTDIAPQAIITENQSRTSVYFTYNYSTYNIQIIGTWVIPEFPSTIILPLLMFLSLVSIMMTKRRLTT